MHLYSKRIAARDNEEQLLFLGVSHNTKQDGDSNCDGDTCGEVESNLQETCSVNSQAQAAWTLN